MLKYGFILYDFHHNKKLKNFKLMYMATHTSILAWRIPWTEEPGGLQSMGSQSRT